MPRAHEVTGIVAASLLRYVRRALGEAGVDALVAATGDDPALLADESAWLPLDGLLRLANAAGDLTGDRDIGRRVGEETMRWTVAQGLDAEQRSRGAPGPAVRVALEFAGRMSTALSLDVADEGPSHIDIELRLAPGAPADPLLCQAVLGYFVQVPEQFGVVSVATHPECLARGDERCRIRIGWSGAVERDYVPRHDAVGQVEQLHAIASELTSAPDPVTLLQLAVDRVGQVVTAPRFVVAALVDGQVLVASHGLTPEEADDALARADERVAAGARNLCVAELRTPRHVFGRLVALFPELSVVGDNDPRLLGAYAGHVAAALEASAALASARRDRDTAQVVLRLARELAGATTSAQVGARLEEAIKRTTEADVVRVERAGIEPATGRGWSVSVPLVARSSVFGSVVAEWWRHPPERSHHDLIRGLVDQAALAFDVAELLDRVRHRALHDELTGLPNRALLKERAEEALAASTHVGTSVALLFVDLDRFKSVNDDLGHAGGDELIRQVGARLRAVVRPSDTVARVGGDEFVVLLPDVEGAEDAMETAEALRGALHAPFAVGAEVRHVSCTIGVATGPAGSWEDLLAAADAAMYRGKDAGRDAVTYSG